jgi:sulfate adenylyltransferase
MSLIPVHGGLDVPVNRSLKLSQRKALLAEAANWPTIQITSADLATVYRIADGTLSPMTGPMNEDVFNRVLDEKVIQSNGDLYAWTIPLSFPVTDAEAAALEVGGNAALVGPNGDIVGKLEVQSVFDWDKARYVKSVYGTDRMDHPGGNIVSRDDRSKMVGGDLWALPFTPNPVYGHQVLTPKRTRALIDDRNFEKALAFQTRNPLHRAHEYALVYGAEMLTRAGYYTGVILNPLVGELKGDDVDAATRMECYNGLRDKRLLGKGDADTDLWESAGYDINDVFELIGLDIKMFYGGPAEAVMHAIYRQNHGFTNIVIGRKHADAPFSDKTAIWGDFDAHAIFDNLGGKLAIEPVKVGFAAYYESMGRVDLMNKHPDEKAFFISGSKVRDILVSGDRPDGRIIRPETADILIATYAARNS